MAARKPKISSLRKVCLPIFLDAPAENILSLVRLMDVELDLLGFARDGENSGQHAEQLDRLSRTCRGPVKTTLIASPDPWAALKTSVADRTLDLLCLEWDTLINGFGVTPGVDVFSNFKCNTAIMRGVLRGPPKKILLPVRGGPQAELSLRIAMSLHAPNIDALHFVSKDIRVDAAFKGLSRVFPQIPGVHPRYEVSDSPAQRVLEESRQADLVVMGSTGQPTDTESFGSMGDTVINESLTPVLLVRTTAEHPQFYEEDILEALLKKASAP